jgi:hypothetical protein
MSVMSAIFHSSHLFLEAFAGVFVPTRFVQRARLCFVIWPARGALFSREQVLLVTSMVLELSSAPLPPGRWRPRPWLAHKARRTPRRQRVAHFSSMARFVNPNRATGGALSLREVRVA